MSQLTPAPLVNGAPACLACRDWSAFASRVRADALAQTDVDNMCPYHRRSIEHIVELLSPDEEIRDWLNGADTP